MSLAPSLILSNASISFGEQLTVLPPAAQNVTLTRILQLAAGSTDETTTTALGRRDESVKINISLRHESLGERCSLMPLLSHETEAGAALLGALRTSSGQQGGLREQLATAEGAQAFRLRKLDNYTVSLLLPPMAEYNISEPELVEVHLPTAAYCNLAVCSECPCSTGALPTLSALTLPTMSAAAGRRDRTALGGIETEMV